MQTELTTSWCARLSFITLLLSFLSIIFLCQSIVVDVKPTVMTDMSVHHDDHHANENYGGLATNKSVEKQLIQQLMENYHGYGVVGRPVRNNSDVVYVNFGLALIQILELDENKQILRTNCWYRYSWKDQLLDWNSWNNTQYNTISQIRVFPDVIWTPDIKLYNFADERLKERRNARVVVHSDGSVMWIPQALLKSTCSVEITFFPYDSQTCVLKFGSWTYDTTQLDLLFWEWDDNSGEIPYIDFRNYVASNEWIADGEFEKMKNANQRRLQIRSEKTYRLVRVINEKGETVVKKYAVLEYKVRLARIPGFLVAILIVPCILLSFLTLVLFWLPPEAPAKMMLGINIFVAFFILLLLLAESTPSAVKTFPLIGIFYCFNMILITLSTFLAVIVINFYFRGDRHGHVPPIVKRILLDGIGRLLCVGQNLPNQQNVKLFELCSSRPPDPTTKVKLHAMRFNKYDNQVAGDHLQAGCSSNCTTAHNDSCRDFNNTSWNEDSPLLLHKASGLERDVREIKRYITMFVSRQRDKDRRSQIAIEWRTFALVLDRIFFILYFLTLVTSIILLLPRRDSRSDFEFQYYTMVQQSDSS